MKTAISIHDNFFPAISSTQLNPHFIMIIQHNAHITFYELILGRTLAPCNLIFFYLKIYHDERQ